MNSSLPPGWRCVNAPDGRIYYYNEQTRETSWTPPPGAASASPTDPSALSTSQSSLPSTSAPAAYPAAGGYPATSGYATAGSYDAHRPHQSATDHLAQKTATMSLAPQPNVQSISYDHGKYTLQSLIAKTSLQQSGTEFFEQERDKLLQINLGTAGENFAWIKNGTMVSCGAPKCERGPMVGQRPLWHCGCGRTYSTLLLALVATFR